METALVTGATDGIGRATALALAQRGFHVIVHGRSRAKADAVVAEVTARGGSASAAIADLADLAQVRGLAEHVRRASPRLKVLVNNAGVSTWRRETTRDGFELQFGVNHLATFLLTELLLPALKAAAPSRIVTVASRAHRWAELDVDDLQTTKVWVPHMAYARSKLCNILFTRELARRLAGTGVTANCLHPGVIGTKLSIVRPLRWILPGPRAGARTSIHLATAPEVAGVSGEYFARRRVRKPAPQARDDQAASRLWSATEALVAAFRPRKPHDVAYG